MYDEFGQYVILISLCSFIVYSTRPYLFATKLLVVRCGKNLSMPAKGRG